MNVLTLWLAVDHSDASNGCLRVVKGSHKSDLAQLKPDRSVRNVLGSATHTDKDIDPSQVHTATRVPPPLHRVQHGHRQQLGERGRTAGQPVGH
jgi:hypothetical protein